MDADDIVRSGMQSLENDRLEPGEPAGGSECGEDTSGDGDEGGSGADGNNGRLADVPLPGGEKISDVPLPGFAVGTAGVRFRVRNGARLRITLGTAYRRCFEAGEIAVEARSEYERYLKPTGLFVEITD